MRFFLFSFPSLSTRFRFPHSGLFILSTSPERVEQNETRIDSVSLSPICNFDRNEYWKKSSVQRVHMFFSFSTGDLAVIAIALGKKVTQKENQTFDPCQSWNTSTALSVQSLLQIVMQNFLFNFHFPIVGRGLDELFENQARGSLTELIFSNDGVI